MTDAQPRIAATILDVIGATPVVDVTAVAARKELPGRLLAKLESFNPGLSKKDRVALHMIREAHRSGALSPGQPVVELTSGNTGTGLAIVCGALGHPFVAVMSRGNSAERAHMMRALGAEVVLVDQVDGSSVGSVSGADLDRVEAATSALVDERGAFRADQFRLQANIQAHELGTGPEFWQQAGGGIDCFVDFVGSGGSFTGVMRALRKRRADVRGYVVEPEGAPALAGGPITDTGHRIQGGGYNRPDLPLLDRSLVSGWLTVTDDEASEGARLLARECGIFAGFSSGANLAAALQVLSTVAPGATVAFLVCDSGLKYLSTDLFP